MLKIETKDYAAVHVHPDVPMLTHFEMHDFYKRAEIDNETSSVVVSEELVVFQLSPRRSVNVVSSLTRHVTFTFWRLQPCTNVYIAEGSGKCSIGANSVVNNSPLDLLVTVQTEIPRVPGV